MAKKANNAQQLQSDFFTLLADLRNKHQVQTFLQDFLSKNELSTLSKRLAILRLLEKDMSYGDIQKELKVSSATISSVAQFKDARPAQVALTKMKIDGFAKGAANKISLLFSKS